MAIAVEVGNRYGHGTAQSRSEGLLLLECAVAVAEQDADAEELSCLIFAVEAPTLFRHSLNYALRCHGWNDSREPVVGGIEQIAKLSLRSFPPPRHYQHVQVENLAKLSVFNCLCNAECCHSALESMSCCHIAGVMLRTTRSCLSSVPRAILGWNPGRSMATAASRRPRTRFRDRRCHLRCPA